MKQATQLPRPAKYKGDAPSQEDVLGRHQAIQGRHDRALDQVEQMLKTQRTLGGAIRTDLAGLRKHSETLHEIEQSGVVEEGLLAALVSRFIQRRTVLNRRSETQALLKLHASVSTRLRKASAFTDALRVVALELQEEVAGLHREIRLAKSNAKRAAQRLILLEERIEALPQEGRLDTDLRNETLDTLGFELRQDTHTLELFQAMEEMCRQHLTPAQKLRDTVTRLQEEMSEFVVAATGTVDAAGRRIQALGAAADAPMVISELQASMDDLSQAMKATEDYVAQTQELLERVLPDLTAQVKAEAETQNFVLSGRLEDIDRNRARSLAKRALQAEAELEVEQLLRGS